MQDTEQEQQTTVVQEFFTPTIDPNLQGLGQSINVDISSDRLTLKSVQPYEGASVGAGRLDTSRIRYRRTINELIDIDNSYVEIDYVIAKSDEGDAAIATGATRHIIDPFFVGSLIKGVKFMLNNDSSRCLTNIPSGYKYAWIANQLTMRDSDELMGNKTPGFLAGPVYSEGDTYCKAIYTDANGYTAGETISRKMRAINYTYGTHTTRHTVPVPLKELCFVDFNGVCPLNNNQIDIEIIWEQDGNVKKAMEEALEAGAVLNANAHAEIFVRRCKLFLVSYQLAPKYQEIVSQKIASGHVDNICYRGWIPREITMKSGEDITQTNIRNLQGVCMFSLANEAAPTNANSGSQFVITTAAAHVASQDAVAKSAGDNVQIQYIEFIPTFGIELADRFQKLYEMYIRYCKIRSGKVPLPYTIYKRVAPFIAIPIKGVPSEIGTNDLIIKNSGVGGAAGSKYGLCMDVLMAYKILADGSILQMTL